MSEADAKAKFEDDIQAAIDWAIQGGMTIPDMQAVFAEIADTMDKYPEDFEPVA